MPLAQVFQGRSNEGPGQPLRFQMSALSKHSWYRSCDVASQAARPSIRTPLPPLPAVHGASPARMSLTKIAEYVLMRKSLLHSSSVFKPARSAFVTETIRERFEAVAGEGTSTTCFHFITQLEQRLCIHQRHQSRKITILRR